MHPIREFFDMRIARMVRMPQADEQSQADRILTKELVRVIVWRSHIDVYQTNEL